MPNRDREDGEILRAVNVPNWHKLLHEDAAPVREEHSAERRVAKVKRNRRRPWVNVDEPGNRGYSEEYSIRTAGHGESGLDNPTLPERNIIR